MKLLMHYFLYPSNFSFIRFQVPIQCFNFAISILLERDFLISNISGSVVCLTHHRNLFSCALKLFASNQSSSASFFLLHTVPLCDFGCNSPYLSSKFHVFLSKVFSSSTVHAINTAIYLNNEISQMLIASILFHWLLLPCFLWIKSKYPWIILYARFPAYNNSKPSI